MTPLPMILLAAAASVGLYLGVLYLRGTAKPTVSVIHGCAGFFGLAGLVVVLRGNPYISDDPHPSHLGTIAAAFLAWTLFAGLVGPLYRETSRRNRELFLLSHAATGLVGVVIAYMWFYRQS